MMGRAAGTGRGRGKHRRENSPRSSEDKGGPQAPTSRHLWIGNLSPHVSQNVLSEQFLRFGDLESISFLPGRSYAFVNFKKEEDAIMALRTLNGAFIAGSPIKIEFQKADKSFSPDAGHMHMRDERHSIERGDFISRRDTLRSNLYETYEGDKNAEPSEVLWIGFPASLHIDEMILGKAFAPFGEIENITTFPGRTYAFVRYRSVVAACKAKEALQGKLFNNPRVSICFARSDISPVHGRYAANMSSNVNTKANLPPLLGGRFSETLRHDRDFDGSLEEPHMPSRFFSEMERHPREADISGIGQNVLLGMEAPSGSNSVGPRDSLRLHRAGSERKDPEDLYDSFRHGLPFDRGAPKTDLSVERPPRGQHFEDTWKMEDADIPLVKKIRVDAFPDRDLPEYPFSNTQNEAEHIGLTNDPDLSQHNLKKSRFDSRHLGYNAYSENPRKILIPHESDDFWRASDAYDATPGSFLSDFNKLQRPAAETHQPLKDEWKWEGTIAKGGTAICRARCFPVGKILDMMLPEFLDCTARTGLDMLAKHFYQAASSWVVFFVPETDSDIAFYNEFMNYLGEKQRAAVAKLGEKTTLFLVPPSEFSEQVLKVPGKMSISGVILRFQQGTASIGATPSVVEVPDSDVPPHLSQKITRMGYDDSSQSKRISPDFRVYEDSYFRSSSGNITLSTVFPKSSKPDGNHQFPGFTPVEKMPTSAEDNRYPGIKHQNTKYPTNWMPPDTHISGADFGSITSSASNASRLVDNHMGLEYSVPKPTFQQGVGSSQYMPIKSDMVLLSANKIPLCQESKTQVTSSAPLPNLQPEQLAQLAVLLEQQKQPAKDPAILLDGGHKQKILIDKTAIETHNVVMDPSASQLVKGHQLQQFPSMQTANHAVPLENHGNQQTRLNVREETETDPQKRLQATLQLAAALLQQIQQQSKD